MLTLFLLLGLSGVALVYIYAGYPLLLQSLVWIRGRRPIRRGDALPPVTLVISAYNEVAAMRAKLENSRALDYPPDLLEVIVISDASDDGTDDIVREFADRGVRLARQPDRRGKTAGLNRFVPEARGEIVVFSDANAMYEPSAIRQLVRNFADPSVGCVTGEARYLKGDHSTASSGERAYWNYEIWIKRLETAVGSMVGGDGAIYAIRRQLWEPLPENAINDFLNPLQIVAAGWRAVYEPEAVCYEETAGAIGREWRRRVRIVGRSWRAVFQARGALNPRRVGLFALCLASHKLLRWFTGAFVIAGLSAAVGLIVAIEPVPRSVTLIATAAAALVVSLVPALRRRAALLAYYGVVSVASLWGVIHGVSGRVSGVWTTVRSDEAAAPQRGGRAHVNIGIAFLALIGVAALAAAFALRPGGPVESRKLVFYCAVAVLAYVYAGYPLLLALMRPFVTRPVDRAPLEPRVCLLIAANDEAPVIEAKLRNCLDLDYPASRCTVVVASDGSVDGTNEIVRSFASRGVRLIDLPERRGKVFAINEALKSIDSEIVVFSDANTFLEKGAIRALVANFADERVGGASGDVILVGDRAALGRSEDLYYRYERWLQQAESNVGSMVGVDGALYAIRRECFVPPPTDTILDDMAIPMAVIRAGWRVVFEPDAIAREQGSETAAEEFARKVRVMAGAVQFLVRRDSAVPVGNPQIAAALFSHKMLRWLSPLFGGLAFVASLSLAPISTRFLVLSAVECGFLLVGLLGCLPAVRRWGPIALAHYFWLIQTAAVVGFVRGARGGQSAIWRRFARPPMQAT